MTDQLTSLPYRRISRGKVRDLYEINNERLLIVSSDRISAFDVNMRNEVPGKGVILNQLTVHWLRLLTDKIPTLLTHLIIPDVPLGLPEHLNSHLRGRCMQVRKLKVFPIEAIVRGYITGSAWTEYQTKGTVHGIPQPEGMNECQNFINGPLYTPSTKAEAGQHDQNISPEQVHDIIDKQYANKIASLSVSLYCIAHAYALSRGIIIADTKFEFGLDEDKDEIVLVDEVLTPDSSRFWPKSEYTVGRPQKSFDKQYLRDWLTDSGLKGREGVEMPENVVMETGQKYSEAYERLTEKPLAD